MYMSLMQESVPANCVVWKLRVTLKIKKNCGISRKE